MSVLPGEQFTTETTHSTGYLFRGLPVMINPLLVRSYAVVVQRTWRERLLSWPWQPLRSERRTTEFEPDPNLFRVTLDCREHGEHQFYVAHPATFDRLKSYAELQQAQHAVACAGVELH